MNSRITTAAPVGSLYGWRSHSTVVALARLGNPYPVPKTAHRPTVLNESSYVVYGGYMRPNHPHAFASRITW